MDLETARTFFMWCTILNGGLLIFSFVILAAARDRVYRIHSRLFPLSREAFNTVIYALLGAFKIIWLIFNVVPWIALLIMQ